MIQNDLKWYREVGFPETVIERASSLIEHVEKFYEIEFDEVYISNIRNNNNDSYTSLWLFSEKDVVECKDFLTRLDLDITRYKGRVKYLNVITDNSETLFKSSSASSMKLAIVLDEETKCLFDAYGANCQRLIGITKRYLNEYKSAK